MGLSFDWVDFLHVMGVMQSRNLNRHDPDATDPMSFSCSYSIRLDTKTAERNEIFLSMFKFDQHIFKRVNSLHRCGGHKWLLPAP